MWMNMTATALSLNSHWGSRSTDIYFRTPYIKDISLSRAFFLSGYCVCVHVILYPYNELLTPSQIIQFHVYMHPGPPLCIHVHVLCVWCFCVCKECSWVGFLSFLSYCLQLGQYANRMYFHVHVCYLRPSLWSHDCHMIHRQPNTRQCATTTVPYLHCPRKDYVSTPHT